MATIYDVAKRAGVSTYTVSSVINRSAYVSPELTARVLDAVRELDYTVNEVARSLQTRTTRTVGLLVPDIASPFYAQIVHTVEQRLRDQGYALILGNTHDSPEAQSHHLRRFTAHQIDGLLLFPGPGDENDLQPLLAKRKAIVFMGSSPRMIGGDVVQVDHGAGTRMMVHHLLEAGHRRIGILVGPREVSENSERIEGWRAGHQQARRKASDDLIGESDGTLVSAHALTRTWLSTRTPAQRPTAIFAAHVPLVAGALKAIREHGLHVPRDFTLVAGEHCDWLDAFDPPVAKVAVSGDDLANRAVDLLFKRMKLPRRRPQTITLTPLLRM